MAVVDLVLPVPPAQAWPADSLVLMVKPLLPQVQLELLLLTRLELPLAVLLVEVLPQQTSPMQVALVKAHQDVFRKQSQPALQTVGTVEHRTLRQLKSDLVDLVLVAVVATPQAVLVALVVMAFGAAVEAAVARRSTALIPVLAVMVATAG